MYVCHIMCCRAVKNYDEFGNFYNIQQRTSFDYSVTYASKNHLIFAIPAAILFSIYTILLPVYLTFYPFKIFRSCLSKCHLDFISVNIFVEKVHNCYRNGLDGGRDLRSFSGLYFFLRMAVFLVGLLSGVLLKVNNNIWMNDAIWFPIGAVFMITALTVALIKPYQKNYMNYLDALLLSNIALCCLVRKPRTALFSLSSARRVLPHAENRFRVRRLVFRVRRTVSACGDRCSAYGGPSPHAETRVPRAEDPLRMRRLVFRVRRTLSACGDSYSACGGNLYS